MIVCPYCSTQNLDHAKVCSTCGASLEGAQYPTALRLGTTLQQGKYKIGKVLGQGGFGITYKAESTALGIPVVVKEFQPSGSTRAGMSVRPPATLGAKEFADARVRFADEARVVARLTYSSPNPHIVRVYDVFTENDTEYYAMEFLEGKPLQSLVEKGGVLSETQVLTIAKEIVGALTLVHSANLLHRDIKPDNIMMVARGAVLIDFGSARSLAAGGRQSIIVTPGYAPLEQYASQARRGPFTDIYALAGTLQFALTGKEPVPATDRAAGASMPTAREINPKVSKPLSDALERAMRMKVDERPQTALEFLDILERAVGGKKGAPTARTTAVTPPPPPPQVQTPPKPAAQQGQGAFIGKPQPAPQNQPQVVPKTPAKPAQQGSDYLWLLYLVCGVLIVLSELRMIPAQSATVGFYGAIFLTAYLFLQWLIGTWIGRIVLILVIAVTAAQFLGIISILPTTPP
jgi:serine/threonine protein kinase